MPYASSRNRSASWLRFKLIGEVVYHQIERDRLFTQASALTYKTLFSLLPVFVLSLLVLSAISKDDFGFKQTIYEQFGINNMNFKDDTGTLVSLQNTADQIISSARNAVSTPATGLIAFAVLLYGAISLMVVIESTFNQIYGSVKARPWLRRIMLYWCVLTLGPVGVAASISLGRAALNPAPSPPAMTAAETQPGTHPAAGNMAIADPPASATAPETQAASQPRIPTTAPGKTATSTLLTVTNVVSGFLISWVLILLMYKVIPDTRVHWRPAAISSFLAALAWEIGKWGFGLYVKDTAKSSVYGSMALLPLFMFWIYITWSVVLIGLEIAYVQQYWPLLRRQYLFIRAARRGNSASGVVGMGAGLSDLRWVLSLGILLYQRFKAGKAIHIDQAAEELMLPNDVTAQLLISLERAGIVHPTAASSYTLARPPESITAQELLAAARGMCQAPPDLAREAAHVATYPKSKTMQQLEELEGEWAKKHTLRDLAE